MVGIIALMEIVVIILEHNNIVLKFQQQNIKELCKNVGKILRFILFLNAL